MGLRGPPKQPTAMKIANGNPGRQRLPENEPEPDGVPLRPDWVAGYAAEVWDRVVPMLVELHVATRADTELLAAFCVAVAQFRQATDDLREAGSLYTSSGTGRLMRHPATLIQSQAVATMTRIGGRFGLTAADRVALAVDADESKPTQLELLMKQTEARGAGRKGKRGGADAALNAG